MYVCVYSVSDDQVHASICSELGNDEADVNIYYELGLRRFLFLGDTM